MSKLYPVQEIGSLSKPRWRTKGLTQPLSSKDLVEAEEWAQRLGIPDFQDRAKQLLAAQEQNDRVRELLELSTIYGLRLFEQTGLDHVQSFDYKYFNKAVAESKIQRKHPIYLQEFLDVKKNAKGQLKVPITGPYTLVDWSFCGHYSGGRTSLSLKKQKQEAKREFLLDFVEQVIRPEIRDLVDAGAEWIQIDEPAITTHPEPADMDLFVEGWNETVRGFNCKFSDHTCYPSGIGYKVLAQYAPKLDKCTHLALEFANRDGTSLGVDAKHREGYRDLEYFIQNGYDGEFGVGVVHVHDFSGHVPPGSGKEAGRNILESPELVRDRLLYAAKVVGDPAKIWANPDCGLRTRTWEVTLAKLNSTVKGAELAREATQ